MCCLFGIIDVTRNFSVKEKNKILSTLAIACEVRGTDATGIAYNDRGRIRVYKRPVPGRKLSINVPQTSRVIMGHTRMETQGPSKKLWNNHPFLGNLPASQFALAHNGMLYNDRELRRNLKLPKTKVETDSYIAVQLIEKKRALTFDSLRYMAEKVEGTFTFTVLDNKDQLYILKGNNPMCLYHFQEAGFYLYASTKEILDMAIQAAKLSHLKRHQIQLQDGEILKLSPDGSITRETFTMSHRSLPWYYAPYYTPLASPHSDFQGYRKYLVDFGIRLGVSDREMEYLSQMKISDLDLELAIYDDGFRMDLLIDAGYYDELEEYNHGRPACYAW